MHGLPENIGIAFGNDGDNFLVFAIAPGEKQYERNQPDSVRRSSGADDRFLSSAIFGGRRRKTIVRPTTN
jgi:hypothetical protein